MKITVKTSTGKEFTMEIEGSDSVDALKQKIQEHEACDVDSLSYDGKNLESGTSLTSYAIGKEAPLLATLKIDNSPKKCAAGCGFYGNPQTMNLCSKCFRTRNTASQPSVSSPPQTPATSMRPTIPTMPTTPEKPTTTSMDISSPAPAASTDSSSSEDIQGEDAQKDRTRCFCCKKKVGLLGINCRCGFTFCPSHRYPEQHKCNFDYKSRQKTLLAAQNPQIVAPKVVKF
jgi:hypothetical protein